MKGFVPRAALLGALLSLSVTALPALPVLGAPLAHDVHTADPKLAYRQAMRRLWEDHIAWTRLVIVSTAAGLPDQDATTQRLLRNQDDIGNAVKPFYGEAAGSKLAALLKDHIVGAANVLAAAKAGDAAGVEKAKQSWYTNADEIAAFLSGANPKSWPDADMKSMMKQHLDLTLSEAVNQLQGRYTESVADYDRVKDEILEMSDMLADGIIAQFPKRF
jgi:hypothetical protein